MDYLTDDILIQSIQRQESDIFDSHDMYFTMMTDWAEEYVRELYESLGTGLDPFVRLHTNIANRMAEQNLNHIVVKHGGKRPSRNCRGKVDECQIWRRTNTT